MDLNKLNIFKTGMTEEEIATKEKEQSAVEQYRMRAEEVRSTMKSSGFKIIMEKIIAQTEARKLDLQRCSKKDLDRLQLEIKINMEFIHAFDEFVG